MYFEPPTPQQTIERVIGNGSSQKEHTNVLIGMSVLLKSLLTVSKKLLSLTITKMDQSGCSKGDRETRERNTQIQDQEQRSF